MSYYIGAENFSEIEEGDIFRPVEQTMEGALFLKTETGSDLAGVETNAARLSDGMIVGFEQTEPVLRTKTRMVPA